MTDDDHQDDERDPLLVRPYLLDGAGDPAGERSAQTWPSATTREVRSQRALEGADDPTAVLHLPTAQRPARHGRRRLLVVGVAGLAVLLGATAAVLVALRDSGRPAVSAALPDAPVPTLSGLVPPAPAVAPASPSIGAPSSASDAVIAPHKSATTRPTTTTPAASPATSAAGRPSTTPSSGRTTAPPAGFAPATPATDRTGTIRGQNGLCLDLNGAVPVDFNHVQVFGCNNTAAQTWTLATDGTLRVMSMCALVVGDDSVRITHCDGRTTAQWRTSGQQLINSAGGKCLTDPSAGRTEGTAVRVTTCDDRANQRWSLP